MMKVFTSCNAELALSADLVMGVVMSLFLLFSFSLLNAFGSLFQCLFSVHDDH
jgi:hypothetical protein